MNLIDADVADGAATLSAGVSLSLSGHLKHLAPGRYRFGLRAAHIRLAPETDADLKIPSTIDSEEITGSETRIYVTAGGAADGPSGAGASLTALVGGVHTHTLGSSRDLFINPARLFAFNDKGELAAAPSMTAATAKKAEAKGEPAPSAEEGQAGVEPAIIKPEGTHGAD
jgi:glycerol transport system ATP-binding protein